MASKFVDLTCTDDEEDNEDVQIEEAPTEEPEQEPLGVSICPDFVDVEEDFSLDDDEVRKETTAAPPKDANSEKATTFISRNPKAIKKSSVPNRKRQLSDKASTARNERSNLQSEKSSMKEPPFAATARYEACRAPKKASTPSKGATSMKEKKTPKQPCHYQQNNPNKQVPLKQAPGNTRDGATTGDSVISPPWASQGSKGRETQGQSSNPRKRKSTRGGEQYLSSNQKIFARAESGRSEKASQRTASRKGKGPVLPPPRETADIQGSHHGETTKEWTSWETTGFRSIFPDFDKPQPKPKETAKKKAEKVAGKDVAAAKSTACRKPASGKRKKTTASSSPGRKKSGAGNTTRKAGSRKSNSTKKTGKGAASASDDVTGEDCEDDPVGVDICVDVVDLCEEDDDDNQNWMPGQEQFKASATNSHDSGSNQAVFFQYNCNKEAQGWTAMTRAQQATDKERAMNGPSSKSDKQGGSVAGIPFQPNQNLQELVRETRYQASVWNFGQWRETVLLPYELEEEDGDGVVSSSYAMREPTKPIPTANSKPKGATPQKDADEEPPNKEVGSPVVVNICVGVDDHADEALHLSPKAEKDASSSVDVSCDVKRVEFGQDGQSKAESPSIRKVSVSEEVDNPAEELIEDAKPPPVIAAAKAQNVSSGLPRDRRQRQDSTRVSFRPNTIAKSKKATQPAKDQNVSGRPTVRTDSAASHDGKPPPCRNFVIIDSSGDESDDECYVTSVKPGRKPIHQMQSRAKAGKTSSNGFGVPKFHGGGHSKNSKPASYRHCKYKKPQDYSYGSFPSQQAAAATQERLFRESADRMKKKLAEDPTFLQPVHVNESTLFDVPFPDVHKHYPRHWQLKDPFARLGLPPKSTVALVKKHYKKLALVYHPDKLKAGDSPEKFHAITAAYRKLTG